MSIRARSLRLIFLLVLCLALAACGGNNTSAQQEAAQEEDAFQAPAAIQEGEPYRDFTAELADGSTFRLSDHQGKVILLNFWATWCGPCVREMPAFPRLMEAFGDDLALVAVNCAENPAAVRSFLEEKDYTFPVALDPEAEICRLYPTDSIPYTVVIAPDGAVAYINLGAADAETMYQGYSAQIQSLLA